MANRLFRYRCLVGNLHTYRPTNRPTPGPSQAPPRPPYAQPPPQGFHPSTNTSSPLLEIDLEPGEIRVLQQYNFPYAHGEVQRLRLQKSEVQELTENVFQRLTQQTVGDDLKEVKINRSTLIRLLVKFAHRSHYLPSCLFIRVDNILEHSVAGGSYGDIFRGVYLGTNVGLKRVRFLDGHDKDVRLKQHCREILYWRFLDHPHVVRFLGLAGGGGLAEVHIVTPWMDNGNMSGFIKARILKLQDSIRLLYEVAQGLAYLHSQSIVHGDLRCSNVLIDAAEHAQLADFGLSLMSDGAEFSVSSTVGSLRWAAPELVQVQHITRNFATDVYAFGCTCLEAKTRQHPFAGMIEFQVIIGLQRGELKPKWPSTLDECSGASEIILSSIAEQCWSAGPSRPPAKVVEAAMREAYKRSIGGLISPL